VFGSDKIFADDTPIPVLDPGRGRTKTGRLWVYVRDDRTWNGPAPPVAVFFSGPKGGASGRSSRRIPGHPTGRRLCRIRAPDCRQPDYSGCLLAHTRRKFYELHEANGSPIAAEALRRIAQLYAIEEHVRGRSADDRKRIRDAESRPLIEAMKPWLERELGRIPGHSVLAEAIRYALARWPALCRFLEDGRVELDTNPVERAIRPVALGRKNHLFAGSDGGGERWAMVCSLIATAKLNSIEPFAYLTDVLQRMVDGHPMARIDDLLPWN
jgi:hypothetical protein